MQKVNAKSKGLPNDELKIKVNSNDNPYPGTDNKQKQLQPRRLASYFIVFIESGSITYKLDLQDMTISDGGLLFAMPNQIFVPPAKTEDLKYFKVLFDENTLGLLPKRFLFLVNPLHSQTIKLDDAAKVRVRQVFDILNQILAPEKQGTDTEIILAYLNLLLSE